MFKLDSGFQKNFQNSNLYKSIFLFLLHSYFPIKFSPYKSHVTSIMYRARIDTVVLGSEVTCQDSLAGYSFLGSLGGDLGPVMLCITASLPEVFSRVHGKNCFWLWTGTRYIVARRIIYHR
jgi:hypothetical protein